MTQLYVLTNKYLELSNTLENSDLDDRTIADTIEASGINDEMSVKAQNIMCIANSITFHNIDIDNEIKRLNKLKERRTKISESLKKYLLENMQRAGIEKIHSPLFSISIKKNPPIVDIYDMSVIESRYMSVEYKPQVITPNKTLIAEAIKNGESVKGARLVQNVRLSVV